MGLGEMNNVMHTEKCLRFDTAGYEPVCTLGKMDLSQPLVAIILLPLLTCE